MVLLTTKKWFFEIICLWKCLGISIIVVENILKFIVMVLKEEKHFEIPEFYQPRTLANI